MALGAGALAGLTIGANALGSAASNIVNSSGRKKSQKRAFQYNEMSADNAAARQREFYDYTINNQRQYELPSEEIRRLRDAGVSVGAYYGGAADSGQITGDSGNAPQGGGVPPNSAPHPVTGFADNVFDALAVREQESRIKLNRSQEDLNDAQSGLAGHQADYLSSQSLANLAFSENTQARTAGELLSNKLAEATLDNNIEISAISLQQNEVLLDQYITAAANDLVNYRINAKTESDQVQHVKQDIRLKASAIALQYALVEASKAGVTLTAAQTRQIETSIVTELAYERPLLAEKEYGAQADRRHTEKQINWFDANQVIDIVRSVGLTSLGAAGIAGVAKGAAPAAAAAPKPSVTKPLPKQPKKALPKKYQHNTP